MASVERDRVLMMDVHMARGSSFVSAISSVNNPMDDPLQQQQSLNLYQIKLTGREEEVDKLLASYCRVSSSTGDLEIIACHGESGVGNSKLIKEALRTHAGGLLCNREIRSVTKPHSLCSCHERFF